MEKIKLSFLAGLFSFFTIGVLSALTYKTDYGVFLIASFGSTMVILYGYPDSPFAQPKNIFFGHLVTALVGIILSNFLTIPIYILLPVAVGLGVGLMIFLDVTHLLTSHDNFILCFYSILMDMLFLLVICCIFYLKLFSLFSAYCCSENEVPLPSILPLQSQQD